LPAPDTLWTRIAVTEIVPCFPLIVFLPVMRVALRTD